MGLDLNASAGPAADIDGTTFGLDINASAGDGVQIVGTTADIDSDITGTLATVTTLTGHTAQTGDVYATLGIVTGAVATDAGNSATTFKVNTDVSTDVRKGFLRLTSGTISGESCLVSWTGTQVTVLSETNMPAALKGFSATPADAVTFNFMPL
jgi:hypothetical protein